jgi:hypothetical protein
MKQIRPLDTSIEAEEVQLGIYRNLGPEGRLQVACDLNRLVRKSMAEGIRLRHPEYNEEEVRLAMIRLTLPTELFMKVYPQAAHILP